LNFRALMGKTTESHAWRTWPNMRQFMPSVANQKHRSTSACFVRVFLEGYLR
jgi:hypothetical protein